MHPKALDVICRILLVWSASVAFTFAISAQPTAITPPTDDPPLTRLSLQELQDVQVTSVSRRQESLLDAASAVYVLSAEDIRRSGATSIPEALRMVPGLNVARINANKWAISARGFNGRFANKQLVMIDGRTVYSPVFSGVYWDVQDIFLEDIDRIEVIRGPGGTLWGANAVNGVINILTKDARDTQGLLVTGGFGTEEHGFGGLRYGGKLADDWYYRVYAKAFNRDDFRELDGREGADEWWQQREGFRVDWTPTEQNHLTLQGDYYQGRSGDRLIVGTPLPPFSRSEMDNSETSGLNLLARWSKVLSADSHYSLQVYYDRTERETLPVDIEVNTLDADFQHRFAVGPRNEVTWGVGYRLIMDDLQGTYNATYNPRSRNDQVFSAFLQDRISLVEDRLYLTPGTKFEHNDYTGWEVQPGVRALLKPTERQSLWAGVSRAVRTPARFEHDLTGNVARPDVENLVAVTMGNRDFESEVLTAYELGYRIQPVDPVFVDLALFYNVYDELRTAERGAPILGAPVRLPITYGNLLEGETYGVEIAPSWQVHPGWRISAGYTLLQMHLHRKAGSTDMLAEMAEGDSPQNQFHIRSFLDLPHAFQFDSALYYVDSLPNQRVPSYTRMDFRIGWSPRPNLEISVVFQNVFDPRHPEFGATTALVTPTEIERSIYGKVTWKY